MAVNKIYFWEKYAFNLKDTDKDKMNFYEIEHDPSIREVIRNLESKIIGKKLLFSEIHPKISTVKKWINKIRASYPDVEEEAVESLLDAFRSSLYSRSRERYRLIVGLLLLKDVMLLLHCKKDPSLAEVKDKIYSVKLILHPKNVLRAAIIRDENGKITFSAFEYSRRWSKAHADFWQIDPYYISWESLGNITLKVELEGFSIPIQLPIDNEQLDEMIQERLISPTGKIKIGREEGTITAVEVFRKTMDFIEFYDFYITEKEKLETHRKKYREIVSPNALLSYDSETRDKFKYEEDENKVYEITTKGRRPIHNKEHPRYLVCFFTKDYPRIKPKQSLIFKLYKSIFENISLDFWHAGEESSQDPITIGCLNIYNMIGVNKDTLEFSEELLNIIQDTDSKKTKYLLQYYFCEFWKTNIKNRNIKNMFDFIEEFIIIPEMEHLFENYGIAEKEEHIEFKSASDVDTKITKFVNEKLIQDIRKYIKEGNSRKCILYGFEDNGKIKPLYHIKNDQITKIEKLANEALKDDNINVKALPIPFKEGIIILISLVPKFKSQANRI